MWIKKKNYIHVIFVNFKNNVINATKYKINVSYCFSFKYNVNHKIISEICRDFIKGCFSYFLGIGFAFQLELIVIVIAIEKANK